MIKLRGFLVGVASIAAVVSATTTVAAVGATQHSALSIARSQSAPTIELVRANGSARTVTGQRVAFRGRATRSMAGDAVKLFRRVNDASWVRVATTRVRSDATFAIAGVATGVGINRWRVAARHDGSTIRSNVVKHKVFKWFAMTDDNAVDASYDVYTYTTAIGGKTFTKAVGGWTYQPGAQMYASWNLGYKCVDFESEYGISDESENNSSASFSLEVGGHVTELGAKELGSPSQVAHDVSSQMRMTLTTTAMTETNALAVWGNPKLLCFGNPF